MFMEIFAEALEGQLRAEGPSEVLRQTVHALMKLRHEVDADTAWSYTDLACALQRLLRNEMEAPAFKVGANTHLAA